MGALVNNGGSTLTHALLAGSPATDTGTNASCPLTDQRGYVRDAACDKGAYEYNA
ncbi:MAG: choice-of-anchor Q domain-containing protein, partial [Nitrososphaera sp.]